MTKDINLGPRESALIFELEKKGEKVFSFQDAKDLLDISDSSVANVIQRLKAKNRTKEIQKGKYLLSPARSGIEGHWSESIYLIVDSVVDEYYVGFWSAMDYWDMTEQVPVMTQVALTKRKRNIKYGDQKIKFITISENRFFGVAEQEVDDRTFKVSDREKTVLDALTYPQHCGGIAEAAKAVWNAREDLDWRRLLIYLKRLDISAVRRRLGYILDVLEIKEEIRQEVRKDFMGFRWLDPSTEKKKLDYSKDWGLKLNLGRKELLEWRENL
ncbi:hypothetical protein AKJ51_05000 [candidate division MSBL1 archaeon SCGC-AAA382A20]|uniref:AbiEi antitoxin C-terminal domain-containing protein n=1 Tax=candidate division MSBL1 archaeon SCGC-AAA382A20 TaxID=1698280 RepID=A0A133VGD0_9EURY|nr:hypothetical protein AKJ51_05000 [candidate division MSBL1 archaeon SCGC-AAA382A20]